MMSLASVMKRKKWTLHISSVKWTWYKWTFEIVFEACPRKLFDRREEMIGSVELYCTRLRDCCRCFSLKDGSARLPWNGRGTRHFFLAAVVVATVCRVSTDKDEAPDVQFLTWRKSGNKLSLSYMRDVSDTSEQVLYIVLTRMWILPKLSLHIKFGSRRWKWMFRPEPHDAAGAILLHNLRGYAGVCRRYWISWCGVLSITEHWMKWLLFGNMKII